MFSDSPAIEDHDGRTAGPRLECIMPGSSVSCFPNAPFTVLAIDTTAAMCSVALMRISGESRQQVVRREPLTPGRSREVLALIDGLFQESGLRPGAVDLIGFGAGPGAFTGLRVACGVAQGLALGWACPVVGVDSLTTLAWQARSANPIVSTLDVRMNEVAIAVFDGASVSLDQPMRVLEGPRLSGPQAAADRIRALQNESSSVRFAGDAYSVYEALSFVQAAPGAVQPDASAVAELAYLSWQAGQSFDAAQAAPFYLRDKVALDRDEQAALRARRGSALPSGQTGDSR